MTKLKSTTRALALDYDVALLDLDGVVYVGPNAVPSVPDALADARKAGMRLAFVTNNAARTPTAVAEHLTALGVDAEPADVITSAQAAAHYLAQRLPRGAKVLVCGTTGIVDALQERGLEPVWTAEEDPVAVLQGFSPTLSWSQLSEAAVAIQRGALWVATNLDRTVPSERGPLPGNGSMVMALRHATGQEPISTGKPNPTMHTETVERSHARRPIVVGDRLDTDIEGARAVGCDSLLVFSGVTTPAEVVGAQAVHRPDYLARDAGGLGYAHPQVDLRGSAAICGRWQAKERGDHIELSCGPSGDDGTPDGLDGLRATAVLCWRVGSRPVRGMDGLAAERVAEWKIGA